MESPCNTNPILTSLLEEALPFDYILHDDLPYEAAFLAGKCFLKFRSAGLEYPDAGQRTLSFLFSNGGCDYASINPIDPRYTEDQAFKINVTLGL
jgi:hypothetical protein